MNYTKVAQFPSSSSSRVYTVKRDEDGNLSCDCPAWRFKKGDKPRSCKHVVQVSSGKAPPPITQTPAVEVKPAGEVMDGLLSSIEEHRADRDLDSLADKLRRLDGED